MIERSTSTFLSAQCEGELPSFSMNSADRLCLLTRLVDCKETEYIVKVEMDTSVYEKDYIFNML